MSGERLPYDIWRIVAQHALPTTSYQELSEYPPQDEFSPSHFAIDEESRKAFLGHITSKKYLYIQVSHRLCYHVPSEAGLCAEQIRFLGDPSAHPVRLLKQSGNSIPTVDIELGCRAQCPTSRIRTTAFLRVDNLRLMLLCAILQGQVSNDSNHARRIRSIMVDASSTTHTVHAQQALEVVELLSTFMFELDSAKIQGFPQEACPEELEQNFLVNPVSDLFPKGDLAFLTPTFEGYLLQLEGLLQNGVAKCHVSVAAAKLLMSKCFYVVDTTGDSSNGNTATAVTSGRQERRTD